MDGSDLEPIETGGLINRNLTVNGRRTSLRLEPEMWDALQEIATREGVRVSDVVSRIDRHPRQSGSGLPARVRVFVLGYFRAAATEEGHMKVGHGLHFRGERRR
jgi:predicted DNA-binding ribbon-helix-helix protein